MRINPILHWSYHDVWSFLRECELPYCSLYDEGYTSLGSTTNTHRNEALRRPDGSFAPAYLLPDARLERAGRGKLERGHPSLRSVAGAPSAGVIVVGDDVLDASAEDACAAYLSRELRRAGLKLRRVVLLPDSAADVAAELRRMSAALDVVLTAGGVGSSPRDRTLEAVAAACDTHLAPCPELERRIRASFGENTTEAHLKLAQLPEGKLLVLWGFLGWYG